MLEFLLLYRCYKTNRKEDLISYYKMLLQNETDKDKIKKIEDKIKNLYSEKEGLELYGLDKYSTDEKILARLVFFFEKFTCPYLQINLKKSIHFTH